MSGVRRVITIDTTVDIGYNIRNKSDATINPITGKITGKLCDYKNSRVGNEIIKNPYEFKIAWVNRIRSRIIDNYDETTTVSSSNINNISIPEPLILMKEPFKDINKVSVRVVPPVINNEVNYSRIIQWEVLEYGVHVHLIYTNTANNLYRNGIFDKLFVEIIEFN